VALIKAINALSSYDTTPRLDSLLNWIDAIQDAAELNGFSVVFLKDRG
jgi:hypothetical protein